MAFVLYGRILTMSHAGAIPLTSVPNVHLKKADIAYGYLRELIINGTFAPGQRLTLAEVSSACGMSHMPVREALLRLDRDGLLESEPHKGVRVVELSLKEAKELFAVRTELEGLAAFAACAAGDSQIVKDLTLINLQFSDAFERHDLTALGAANQQFHERILQAGGNAVLARMLREVWSASQRYRLGYKLIPGRAHCTIEEHASIIAAMASGDPERARVAARAHIERAGSELASVSPSALSV